MDDHYPDGFYHFDGHPTVHHPAPSPWGIPLRSLCSIDFDNLFFVGRNISATHAAFSSCRVIATCAMMGQAVGTAVSMLVNDNIDISELNINKLQQLLMYDDCYLPNIKREVSPLINKAVINYPVVCNGYDRKNENLWIGNKGDYIEFVFNEPQYINELRIIFDSDLNRNYVEWLDRSFQQMPHIYPLGETRFRLPETLIKKFKIVVCNEKNEVSEKSYENHLRFVKIEVNQSVKFIRLIPEETWGADDFRIFSVEPV